MPDNHPIDIITQINQQLYQHYNVIKLGMDHDEVVREMLKLVNERIDTQDKTIVYLSNLCDDLAEVVQNLKIQVQLLIGD